MSHPDPLTVPLPKDPRHQRFADLHALQGLCLADAYIAAGYKVGRAAARSAGARLMKRPDVTAYLAAIRGQAAGDTILSVNEILRFCARVVRTGIGDLDPSEGSPTADLIKNHSETESETGGSRRIEKLCPFKAIDTHLKLTGEDPHQNALKDIAAAIGSLGGHPLPTDRL